MKTQARAFGALALTLALLTVLPQSANAAAAISSFVFADVIKANGRGSIDLFKPKSAGATVSGPILEAFRQDNLGDIVFAVDVNEASSGSEFSDSQGIAIEHAVLRVLFGSTEVQFSAYRTPTRSLLAVEGSTARSEYHTLIGTSGTNRISPNTDSELTNSSIDETLYFAVDADLSAATGAVLDITLLTTNVALGDPEAFYDFSNGYEEVALLTREDVLYLEQLAPGRELAPLVIVDEPSYSWAFYPSSQSYYIVAYEDLYPTKGDYDFNDLVVAYQVGFGMNARGEVAMIRGNGYLLARGAAYDHDWRLRIELPTWASGSANSSLFPVDSYTPYDGFPKSRLVQGSLDLALAEHIATIYFDGGSTYVNTYDHQTVRKGPKFDFQLALDVPVPSNEVGTAPFDPYLYVHETGYEIHLVDKVPVLGHSNNFLSGVDGFRDDSGFPFALVLPENWQPPLAGIDMGLAYPTFIDFVTSRATEDMQWHASPDAVKIKEIPASVWKW